VIAAVFDDLMFHAVYSAAKQQAVTASIEVHYRRPARIGARLYGTAHAGEIRHGRFIDVTGEIRDQDGMLIADARSKYVIMSDPEMNDFQGENEVKGSVKEVD
jgi:acyl-coenzyme A thioesterase PaaI-like protein